MLFYPANNDVVVFLSEAYINRVTHFVSIYLLDDFGVLRGKLGKIRTFTSTNYQGKICLIHCCQMNWRSIPLTIILVD